MSEIKYIDGSVLVGKLTSLIKTDRSTIEIKGKLLPMIESLETAKDDAVTAEDVMAYLRPYVEENIKLNEQLKSRDEQIRQLEKKCKDQYNEISRLERYHSDSGLKRDEEMPCLYVIHDITTGQFAGQKDTRWYCPVCSARLGNWEDYCVYCGQKLSHIYIEENERSVDKATGQLIQKTEKEQ